MVVRDIFSIIHTVNQEGITILLIEQNANAALRAASYGYVLETGTITLAGTGAELLENARVREAYLGKPREKRA
jgi:branched-chain amino acid transport system ATP-binding protein